MYFPPVETGTNTNSSLMSSAFPPIDTQVQKDVAPEQGGVISGLKGLYKRGKERVIDAKNKIVDIAKENAANDLYSSDKNLSIQDFADTEVLANVFKPVMDTAFDVVKTGAKGVLTDKGEQDIKSGIEFLGKKGKQLAESEFGQDVGELLNKGGDIAGKKREESTLEFLIPDKGDRELAIQLSNFLPVPVVDDLLRNAGKLAKGTLDESFFKGLKTGVENVGTGLKTVGETIAKPLQSVDVKTTAGNLSDRILTNANRMTKGDIAKFVEAHGETPGAFLNNRGITKTGDELFDELASKAKQSKANADEAVDLIEGKYRMPEVDTIDGMEDRIATMLQDNIDKARKIGDNEGGIRNKKLFDDYNEGGLTLKEITDAQRYMQKNNKFTYFDKGSDRAQFVTNLDSDVRNWKFQVAEDNGFTNWKPINKETQAYNTMLSKMSGWAEGVTGNNPISLTDWLAFSADPKLFLAKQLVEAGWFKRNIVKGLNKIAKREGKIPLTPFDKESIIREQVKKQYGFSNPSSGNNTLEAISRSQVKQLPSGEGKTRSADVVDVQTRNVGPRGQNPSDITSRSVIKDPRIIIEGKTPSINIAKIKLERALMNLTSNPEGLNNAMKEIATMFADGRLTPEDVDVILELLRKSGLYVNEAGEVVPIKLLGQPKVAEEVVETTETPLEAPKETPRPNSNMLEQYNKNLQAEDLAKSQIKNKGETITIQNNKTGTTKTYEYDKDPAGYDMAELTVEGGLAKKVETPNTQEFTNPINGKVEDPMKIPEGWASYTTAQKNEWLKAQKAVIETPKVEGKTADIIEKARIVGEKEKNNVSMMIQDHAEKIKDKWDELSKKDVRWGEMTTSYKEQRVLESVYKDIYGEDITEMNIKNYLDTKQSKKLESITKPKSSLPMSQKESVKYSKKDIADKKYNPTEIYKDYTENYMHSDKWKGKSKAIVIDSDAIKKMFNEYDPKNPGLVHEESSKLSKEFFDRAVAENPDSPVVFSAGGPASGKSEGIINGYHGDKAVIFDTVLGDFEAFLKKAKSKIKDGKVKVHAIYTDIDTAKKYNAGRDRSVPESLLESKHKGFRKAMDDLINSKEYKDGKIAVEVRANKGGSTEEIPTNGIEDFIREHKNRLDIK